MELPDIWSKVNEREGRPRAATPQVKQSSPSDGKVSSNELIHILVLLGLSPKVCP